MEYATIDDLAKWAETIMAREPDFVIGDNYLRRWWVIPRNAWSNVYLHHILRNDDDRALHDHPADNRSVLIKGSYREITEDGVFIREAGEVIDRAADTAHRLELINGEPAVSLFFMGPKIREWGFHCPNGWVHWRDFTAGENGELVGAGCGD